MQKFKTNNCEERIFEFFITNVFFTFLNYENKMISGFASYQNSLPKQWLRAWKCYDITLQILGLNLSVPTKNFIDRPKSCNHGSR